MEHTPGPWTFVQLGSAPSPGFIYGIGHDPLGSSDVPWPTALAVTDADARLIAAAPALLLALEGINDEMAPTTLGTNTLSMLFRQARAAILAAKGEK